jgi:hypothetical protein
LSLPTHRQLAGQHLTFDVELLTLTAQDSLQKATFGAGCFWGPELAFQRVPGAVWHLNQYIQPCVTIVIASRAGYINELAFQRVPGAAAKLFFGLCMPTRYSDRQ